MGQSQPRVRIWFWFWRRRFFKLFTIYEHGSHVGHVTQTIWATFSFLKALEAVYEIWLQSAQQLQRRSRLKLWTDGGACLYYKLPQNFWLRWAKKEFAPLYTRENTRVVRSLMAACLSRLQSYKWDHKIKVTVTYKMYMYEVIHSIRLKRYLKHYVFLYRKVGDTRQKLMDYEI